MPFLTILPPKQTRLKDIFKKNTPEGLRKLPSKKKALSSSFLSSSTSSFCSKVHALCFHLKLQILAHCCPSLDNNLFELLSYRFIFYKCTVSLFLEL